MKILGFDLRIKKIENGLEELRRGGGRVQINR